MLTATITWLDPMKAPTIITGERWRVEKSNLEIITPLEGAAAELDYGDVDLIPLRGVRMVKLQRRP